LQKRPSAQGEPSGFAGSLHTPVAGLHVPALWHWLEGVQMTGFAPVQTPLSQVSDWVQAFASVHAVPFGLAGSLQTPVCASQTPAS
jgi:hypothetical protein